METKQDKIEKTELLLENLLIEQFITDRHGEDPDYSTDSEVQPHDGRKDGGTDVWIEIECAPQVIAKLDEDYETFAKSFEEWAKRNDLSEPEILSTETAITYRINID